MKDGRDSVHNYLSLWYVSIAFVWWKKLTAGHLLLIHVTVLFSLLLSKKTQKTTIADCKSRDNQHCLLTTRQQSFAHGTKRAYKRTMSFSDDAYILMEPDKPNEYESGDATLHFEDWSIGVRVSEHSEVDGEPDSQLDGELDPGTDGGLLEGEEGTELTLADISNGSESVSSTWSTSGSTSSSAEKRVKRQKSTVRSYLDDQPDGRSLCKVCQTPFGNKTGTSTIMRHFESKHNSIYLQLRQRQLDAGQFRPYGRQDQAIVDDINDSLLTLVVARQEPFSLVDSLYFKAFCKTLNSCYILPTRQTMVKRVLSEYNEWRGRLRTYLATQPGKFSFTTDIWSACNQQSYLGVTVHWIDAGWKLHSLFLDILPLQDAHTAEHIARQLFEALEHFAIGDRALCVTTDNATNMVKMGQILHTKVAQRFDNPHIMHLRCIAHVLNLGVKDGLRQISPPVIKARTFCNKLRASPMLIQSMKKLAASLDEEFKMPLNDVVTRWNSTYLMLSRFEDIKGVTDVLVIKHPELEDGYPTPEERRTIKVSDKPEVRLFAAHIEQICTSRR